MAIDGRSTSSASRARSGSGHDQELVVAGGIVAVYGDLAAEGLRHREKSVGAGTAVTAGTRHDVVVEIDRAAWLVGQLRRCVDWGSGVAWIVCGQPQPGDGWGCASSR